ncbi:MULTISPECIES: MFS transporter [unclassified Nocardiopsis]|uniref:MFS transporter n=1 Tax=unclassified Nocardiopsis TaxID=2649073 RepID=UPI00135C9C2F|nr:MULTISPECIES: MFS transporter [unclassified Nocardiopsis]
MTRDSARAGGGVAAVVAIAVPMFMVALDNLIVTHALPQIRAEFGGGQSQLQWVVNAYVLAFAGLLMAASALGDRFGRRRVFAVAVAVFTLASAWCATSSSLGELMAARVLQGAGAAALLPLSLTLTAAAVRPEHRNAAVGAWGGVNGLGIAMGPLVGGVVTETLGWNWVFWINVPVGLAALPAVLWLAGESRGGSGVFDLPGAVLITGGLVAAVWGVVNAAETGWSSPATLGALAGAAVLVCAFLLWQRRTPAPLVPLDMFRNGPFGLSLVVSLAMYFGVFGSVFLLAQYMQGPLGYAPFEAGLRTLPWTAAPMVVVPVVGLLIDRWGGGRLQALGCAMQAGALGWLALYATADLPYTAMLPALVVAGVGMGVVFAANPAVVIASVDEDRHGTASGVNNTVREFGGALGIAAISTVFVLFHPGGAPTDAAFVEAMRPAVLAGALVTAVGAAAALFIRRPSPGARSDEAPRAPAPATAPSREADPSRPL